MHPHETARLHLEALRLENENTAFRLGHLTASFEHIIQQADELAMRRQLAWGRCVEAARQGRRPSQADAEPGLWQTETTVATEAGERMK